MNIANLDEFTYQYVITALWSSCDDNDEPLDDNYNVTDISEECLNKMIEDCKQFQTDNWNDIAENLSGAGHDFWLTRNHHGAGFWDGDWPNEVGERLTVASKQFGEVELYVGDHGLIYCM